jgi:hypothetical protein
LTTGWQLYCLQQVRAAVAFKLALHGREAEAAAAMPSCRAFTGAVQVTCTVGSSRKKYRGMVALMRYAAYNWPHLTHVALACVPNCPALTRCVTPLQGGRVGVCMTVDSGLVHSMSRAHMWWLVTYP